MKDKKTKWKLTKPQNGRDMHDWGFIEAICSHGIGHHKGVHGCDRCCNACPEDIWAKVTEDKASERKSGACKDGNHSTCAWSECLCECHIPQDKGDDITDWDTKEVQQGCCDKCRKSLNYVPFCSNSACHCHSPQPPKSLGGGWETRFNKECPMVVRYKQGGTDIIDFDYMDEQREKVKVFISSLLTSEREAGYELRDKEYAATLAGVIAKARADVVDELVEKVEGMRGRVTCDCFIGCGYKNKHYERAISDILAFLKDI